jgi:hypothetical protein
MALNTQSKKVETIRLNKKASFIYMMPTRHNFKCKDIKRLETKGLKKIHYANMNQKEFRISILK